MAKPPPKPPTQRVSTTDKGIFREGRFSNTGRADKQSSTPPPKSSPPNKPKK